MKKLLLSILLILNFFLCSAPSVRVHYADTLDSITDRGSTTDNDITISNDLTVSGTTSNLYIPSTAGSVLFSDGAKIEEDNSNLYWDDTNNRLGIGTVSPADTLDVAGTLQVQNASDSTTAYQFLDANGGTPILNIDSTNERVGIGTATPTGPLDVSKSVDGIVQIARFENPNTGSSARVNMELFSDSAGFQMFAYGSNHSTNPNLVAIYSSNASDEYRFWHEGNSGYMTFYTDGPGDNERMRITNDGDVGIGDTTPDAKLDVEGDAIVTSDLTISGATFMGNDLIFSGTGGGLPGGCVKGTNQTVTCTNQNQWYQVIFDTVGATNLTIPSAITHDIIIMKAGEYAATPTINVHSAVAHDFEFMVKKNNGTVDGEPYLFQSTAVAGQVENVSGTCSIYAEAGDTIELWTRCTDAAGQDIIFDTNSLFIKMWAGP